MTDENGSATAGNPGDDAGQEGGGAAAPQSWVEGITDTETRQFLENKGFNKIDDPAKAVGEVARSYRNLEKMFGADKAGRTVVLPPDGDEAARDAFYEKLGRPADPKGYELNPDESDNPKFVEAYQEWAFKHGLTPEQAKGLREDFKSWTSAEMDALNAETEAEREARMTQETNDLKREWGKDFDKNVSLGQRAARAFGVPQDKLDAIEQVMGFKETMALFHKIGSQLGEDKFIEGEASDTVHSARAKLAELESNEPFRKRFLAGDTAAVAEMNKWRKLAYGGGSS